jgi:hypothetical protein
LSTWDAVPPNEALRLWLKVQLQQKPCESLHCFQHSRQQFGPANACFADGQQAQTLERTQRLFHRQQRTAGASTQIDKDIHAEQEAWTL